MQLLQFILLVRSLGASTQSCSLPKWQTNPNPSRWALEGKSPQNVCTPAALVPWCLHTATIWTVWQCREMSGAIKCSLKGCSDAMYQQIESHSNTPVMNFSLQLVLSCANYSLSALRNNAENLKVRYLKYFYWYHFFRDKRSTEDWAGRSVGVPTVVLQPCFSVTKLAFFRPSTTLTRFVWIQINMHERQSRK